MWLKEFVRAKWAVGLFALAVKAVGILSWFAEGIAVVGDTKLHWPLFLGVGALLVGVITPDVIRWWTRERRGVQRERILWADLHNAHRKLQGAVKPLTLDPEHPGNPHAIREAAVNATSLIAKRLTSMGYDVPPAPDRNDDHLRAWYKFVGTVMAELKGTRRAYD